MLKNNVFIDSHNKVHDNYPVHLLSRTYKVERTDESLFIEKPNSEKKTEKKRILNFF